MKLWIAATCVCLGIVASSQPATAQLAFPVENLTWDDFTVDFPVTG